MKVLTAPNYIDLPKNVATVFLAGGISGCINWQEYMLKKFEDTNLFILNPRRDGTLDRKNILLSTEQIRWENHYLNQAEAILFWFPKESVCPIALFELGAALERKQEIFIGCDPEYDRIVDIQIQCQIKKYFHPRTISFSLDDLATRVKHFYS